MLNDRTTILKWNRDKELRMERTDLKEKFMLDPAVHFLNHGSFGACPKEVLAAFHDWVERSERQPVLFYMRQFQTLMKTARAALARFIGTEADRLVYIPNATHGVNLIARSIPLECGDEVLMTDHEYGACENVWALRCAETGAELRKAAIPVPYRSCGELRDRIFESVGDRTRVIFLSHISSPTALTFPVAEIARFARSYGIILAIDGAHAPGQLELNLDDLGADFYTGNCHKWMCAPKGSAFLAVAPEWVNRVEPNVISWGTGPNLENTIGNRLIDGNEWLGTQGPFPALSVPSAIDFLERNDWRAVRAGCRELLTRGLNEVNRLFGFEPVYPDERAYVQLGIAEVPAYWRAAELKAFLYDRFAVEIPIIRWNGRNFVRISIQGYNQDEDIDALIAGLESYGKTNAMK